MAKVRERFWVFLALVPFFASGLPFESGFELAGRSRYLWRGLRLSQGPVAQPAVWASFAGWTISPWANITLGHEGDGWGLNELDLTVSYQQEISGFSIEPSAAGYFYADDWAKPELELGVNVAYGLGDFELTSGHNLGVFPSAGGYFGTIGGAFSREVGFGLAPEVSLSAGWGSPQFNEINYGVARWKLNVIEFGVGLNYSLKGLLDIKPFLEMSVVPDPVLRNAGGSEAVQAVFGLTMGRGF